MIIDIHTHRPYPQPEGIISKALRPDSAETSEMKSCQLYSVGVHPWDTQDTEDAGLFARLEEIAAQPNVAAIGECGIDLLRARRCSGNCLCSEDMSRFQKNYASH